MPFYMYQGAYTSQSWAAQVKNPQNRIETVGHQACEAVGGKMVGAWYCFGDFDFILIADVPNIGLRARHQRSLSTVFDGAPRSYSQRNGRHTLIG